MQEALDSLGQTAEGLNTIRLVATHAETLNVYMPLATALYEIIYLGKPLDTMIARLMGGEHKHDVEFSFHGGAA